MGSAAGGILYFFVSDFSRPGADKLLEAVKEQVPFMVDTFVQDVQPGAFQMGGSAVYHDGAGFHPDGNRRGKHILPGKGLFLRFHRTGLKEEDCLCPVLPPQAKVPNAQTERFRQHRGGAFLRILPVGKSVFPEPLRRDFHLVPAENRHQVFIELPQTALRLGLSGIQILNLKAEPLVRIEPQRHTETEVRNAVLPVGLHCQGDGQIDIGKEISPVQPPVSDPRDAQVTRRNPFRHDGETQQKAQIPSGKPAVHLLHNPVHIPGMNAAVHIADFGNEPGFHRRPGLILPHQEKLFLLRRFAFRRGGSFILRDPVFIFPDLQFHSYASFLT